MSWVAIYQTGNGARVYRQLKWNLIRHLARLHNRGMGETSGFEDGGLSQIILSVPKISNVGI
jgi:hypothetical protein